MSSHDDWNIFGTDPTSTRPGQGEQGYGTFRPISKRVSLAGSIEAYTVSLDVLNNKPRMGTPPAEMIEKFGEAKAKAIGEVRLGMTSSCRKNLAEARVFHIGAQSYVDLYHECDVITTEEVTGETWEPRRLIRGEVPATDNRLPKSEDDAVRYFDAVTRFCNQFSFPERLPFTSVFFGLGVGANLGKESAQLRISRGWGSDADDAFIRAMKIRGYLVTTSIEGNFVIEFCEALQKMEVPPALAMSIMMQETLSGQASKRGFVSEIEVDEYGRHFQVRRATVALQTYAAVSEESRLVRDIKSSERRQFLIDTLDTSKSFVDGSRTLYPMGPDGTGWVMPFDLTPMIIPALCEYAMGVGSKVVKGSRKDSGARSGMKKGGSGKRRPPPFYVVEVGKDTHAPTVRAKTDEAKKRNSGSYSFRHDVSSHDRVIVRRGSLPLPADVRESLERPRKRSGRAYRVFTGPVPLDVATALYERGHEAQSPGEWIAILVTPIPQTIRGDSSLPYIPATRVPCG